MTCTGTMFRLYVILPAAQIPALDGRTFTEQLIEFCRNLLRVPEDKYEKKCREGWPQKFKPGPSGYEAGVPGGGP